MLHLAVCHLLAHLGEKEVSLFAMGTPAVLEQGAACDQTGPVALVALRMVAPRMMSGLLGVPQQQCIEGFQAMGWMVMNKNSAAKALSLEKPWTLT